MLCLDNSFCSGQSCRSTRYLVRQNLKVLTISIMLLGRIHFNMVWLAAHNYAQRSAVCAVGAESWWRVFLHSWCDTGLWWLLLNSRVGKNRDTRREPPAGAGAACTAIEGLSFWTEYCRGAEANCIYRPVSRRLLLFNYEYSFYFETIHSPISSISTNKNNCCRLLAVRTIEIQKRIIFC